MPSKTVGDKVQIHVVGDTVLFSISFSMSLVDLFFFCSSFFLSLDLVSVNHEDHYYVYIYTCFFLLRSSDPFLFVRFRSRVVPLLVAVSLCSINIEHTLTHTSFAQTSTHVIYYSMYDHVEKLTKSV